MAEIKRKVLKFKDAPKKTRKKRKTTISKGAILLKVEPSTKELKDSKLVKKEPKQSKKETSSQKKPENTTLQDTKEEQVKVFGMGNSSGDINFGAQIKTSWGKFKNIFKKATGDKKISTGNKKTSEEKQKQKKSSVKDDLEKKAKPENQTTVIKGKPLKLLPAGTLLMLPAPRPENLKTKNFPKIYRFITETWVQVVVLSLVLLVSIGLMFRELEQHMQQKNALEQKRAGIQKEISYWQGVIRKYQDYRDGYFKLALLEYQLGNTQAAELYVEKTKMLDPNFTQADTLEKILSSI